jgi:hypothetical protein
MAKYRTNSGDKAIDAIKGTNDFATVSNWLKEVAGTDTYAILKNKTEGSFEIHTSDKSIFKITADVHICWDPTAKQIYTIPSDRFEAGTTEITPATDVKEVVAEPVIEGTAIEPAAQEEVAVEQPTIPDKPKSKENNKR